MPGKPTKMQATQAGASLSFLAEKEGNKSHLCLYKLCQQASPLAPLSYPILAPTMPLVYAKCPRCHIGGSHLEVGQCDEARVAQAGGVASHQGKHVLLKILGSSSPAARVISTLAEGIQRRGGRRQAGGVAMQQEQHLGTGGCSAVHVQLTVLAISLICCGFQAAGPTRLPALLPLALCPTKEPAGSLHKG